MSIHAVGTDNTYTVTASSTPRHEKHVLLWLVLGSGGGGEERKERGGEGRKERGGEGRKERGGEGRKERGGEGRKERGGEGRKERGGEGRKERGGEGGRRGEQVRGTELKRDVLSREKNCAKEGQCLPQWPRDI
ncbi:hypothetical protein Pmani_005713 [Petrolisthes manimaculis]|uniref:Uncharacterized protein n=1 Tax=Petrolisthes manimaculis TaxID=1843537 RepID=A0AAE1UGE8_9EUCA|nr:hypothetical protein Pmani_005713 [Petrolisthes manimaculis]